MSVEPHIYALRQVLKGKDVGTYLEMFRMWKRKMRGEGIDPDAYGVKVKQYTVEADESDCESCKI